MKCKYLMGNKCCHGGSKNCQSECPVKNYKNSKKFLCSEYTPVKSISLLKKRRSTE